MSTMFFLSPLTLAPLALFVFGFIIIVLILVLRAVIGQSGRTTVYRNDGDVYVDADPGIPPIVDVVQTVDFSDTMDDQTMQATPPVDTGAVGFDNSGFDNNAANSGNLDSGSSGGGFDSGSSSDSFASGAVSGGVDSGTSSSFDSGSSGSGFDSGGGSSDSSG